MAKGLNIHGMASCVQPYALNAATLATRGVDTLGGVLQRGLPFDVGLPLANRLLGALTATRVSDVMTGDTKVCVPVNALMWLSHMHLLAQVKPSQGLHPAKVCSAGSAALRCIVSGWLAGCVRGLRGRPRPVVLGGDALAAHAHVDPATGRLLTFSHRVRMTWSGPVTRLMVYEFDQVGILLHMPGQPDGGSPNHLFVKVSDLMEA